MPSVSSCAIIFCLFTDKHEGRKGKYDSVNLNVNCDIFVKRGELNIFFDFASFSLDYG